MARPTHNPIQNGQSNWDADVNDNFDLAFTTPLPPAEFANVAALPAADLYDRCIAVTVDTNSLWLSNGTTWLLVRGPVLAAIAKPAGGATVDAEARTAIDLIIDRLVALEKIAP